MQFVVEQPAATQGEGAQPKYAVLIHGLGTSLEVYDDLSVELVNDGERS